MPPILQPFTFQRPRFCAVLRLSLGCLMTGWAVAQEPAKPASAEAEPARLTPGEAAAAVSGTIVHYVSEAPYRWEGGNPLESIAQTLSNLWAEADANGNRMPSLQRQLSRDALDSAAMQGRPEPQRYPAAPRQRQVFVVHGYEFCASRAKAKFQPLLVAAKDGKPATAEFIVVCRKGDYKSSAQDFQWLRLEDREILVDRGNCGELVNYWLDLQVYPAAGKHAGRLAQLRNTGSAAEALLAVYFREAEACVVTRESYDAVLRHNPEGLAAKLEIVCASAPLLRYVAATSDASMDAAALRPAWLLSAADCPLELTGGAWSLIPAKSEHFTTLNEFTAGHALKVPPRTVSRPAASTAPAAAAASGQPKTETRRP